MNAETALMIPRTWLIASRLHKAAGRPVYLGWACTGLALFAVGVAAGVVLTSPCSLGDCEHDV